MANPQRGQVSIKAGSQTLIVKFSTNAICEAEGEAKKSFGELVDALASVDFRAMRVLLWAGTKERDPSMTLEKAGDLIDDIEPLELLPKLNEAIELAYPKTAKAGNTTARPQTAAEH
jgi:hypothetical protein